MLRITALALAALLLGPAPAALAKEESKIQIRLEAPSGNSSARGEVRTRFQGSRLQLQLRVRGLEPDAPYALLCLEDAGDPAPAELFSFETGGSGSANVKRDLAEGDPPCDPRGKLLVVVDAVDDAVLEGWLYGDVADDGPKTKVKERTGLAPDPDADPEGRVEALYRTLPNGRGSLSVATRHISEGDYELLVDGVLVAGFSPNSGGNAKLDFRIWPGKAKGPKKPKPHRKKQLLDFDPRCKEIEVRLVDGPVLFAGPMLAQFEAFEGLDSCAEPSDPGSLSRAGERFGPTPGESEGAPLQLAIEAGLPRSWRA